MVMMIIDRLAKMICLKIDASFTVFSNMTCKGSTFASLALTFLDLKSPLGIVKAVQ